MAHAVAPTPFATDERGVEMDVDDLRRCVGQVLAGLGDGPRRRVVAAGVAGIAESGAPLDRSRRPLARVIAWHDGRGHEQVALVEERFGPGLALRTGERLRAVSTAAKLGWLLAHGVQEVDRWLGVPELVLLALTGEEATEYSLAARTGCYDVTARTWIPEVATLLGFDVAVFAPVRPAGTAMGRVTPAGAALSGLPEGIPVTVAGHDHLAGMGGAGLGRHDMANSVGTAETIVARTADLPDIAAAMGRRVAVKLFPRGTEWSVLVGAVRAGLVLETAAAALGRSPADLDRLADVPDGRHPMDASAAVDGLAHGNAGDLPDGPPGAVWAGLLDALAARTAGAYERLAAVVGVPERMVVFGGGSVSDRWLRAKAAALPVPVVRSTVDSAVARGAALYAGVAAGWWPSVDDAPLPPPVGGTVTRPASAG